MKSITMFLLCLQFYFAVSYLWHDCGKKDAVARVDKLQVDPFPIRFGQTLFGGASISVLRQVPEDAMLGLDVWRVFRIFGAFPFELRMPCMFGTDCRANLCLLATRWFFACNFLLRTNHSCTCPIEPGTYRTFNYPIPIPNTSGFISFFGAGTYKGRITLFDRKLKTELACLEVVTSLQ